ncbi:MAG: multifunctional CCA tRNA nucleotidyl transferase/2'3'-cyclic phosphodiesterase/2'nucleotidase/phosphatase [Pseudomonadota bacterium]
MQRYLVGGAVRDRLLGLPVKDRDFVVVGTTPEAMLAQGFVPVGRDFPVFLHPQTHEEYALARTERKTAPGYKGFVFHAQADVTLEQDLARRDLTINAMAQAEDGSLIDPFNGQADLRARLLRHVSPAFLEDPVRILRIARFSARFVDFSIAPATAELMRTMVENGEVDALVPERAWQEFSRGLMEVKPSRMVEVLHACGALARLLPAVAQLWHQTSLQAQAMLASLDAAAIANAVLPVRYAILLQPTALPAEQSVGGTDVADTAPIEAASKRLKVPSDCRDLARMTGRECGALFESTSIPEQALALLERCDALRKPTRFNQMLEAITFLYTDDPRIEGSVANWRRLHHAVLAVDTGFVAAQVQRRYPGQPLRINAAVRAARMAAILALLPASD